MEESIQQQCRACRQPIASQATLCHHCGSTQTTSFWAFLGNILKWIGGVTAVLSLLAGVIQLNVLFKDWLKNKQAVAAYLKAAELQFYSGDHENAQLLLQKVAELDPTSGEARDLQIDFLMAEMRTYYFTNWQNDNLTALNIGKNPAGLIDFDWGYIKEKKAVQHYLESTKAHELMALGAALTTGERKADILAHLAWIELLIPGNRNRTEISELFDKALQNDPGNPFAHIMYSAMIGRYENDTLEEPQKLAAILDHFRQARKPRDKKKQNQQWFQSMQFEILSRLRIPEAEIEMLRLAETYAGGQLFASAAEKILRDLSTYVPDVHPDGTFQENSKTALLHQAFKDSELIKLTNWLGQQTFGCLPGPGCSPSINYDTKFHFYESIGYFYEHSGQYQEALQAYRTYQKEHRAANRSLDAARTATLKRLMFVNNIPDATVQIVVQPPSEALQENDLVYSYDGRSDMTIDQIITQQNESPKKPTHELGILRDGKSMTVPIDALRSWSVRDYIIPAEMIQKNTTPGRTRQLFDEWVWVPGTKI